jgi:VanZ family protein
MGLIFYLSSEGHSDSSGRSLPLADFLGLPEWLVRKSAHFVLYFILGVLTMNALIRSPTNSSRRYILLAALICILYAAIDEWHQSWNPERSAQLTDVILDSTASLFGIFMLYYIHAKITARRHHRPH